MSARCIRWAVALGLSMWALILWGAGCISTGTVAPGPSLNSFPPQIRGQCERQLAAAKAGIEKIDGKALEIKFGVNVRTARNCEWRDGMWVWGSEKYGWIGGYYSGQTISVGANPTNGLEVADGVLLHEFGHYLLAQRNGGMGHPAKYDPVFHWSWCDGKARQP